MQVIAKKWWDERKISYPHHQITTNNKKHNPDTLAKFAKDGGFKVPFDYISTGLLGGGRVWGFLTAADADQFTKLVGNMK